MSGEPLLFGVTRTVQKSYLFLHMFPKFVHLLPLWNQSPTHLCPMQMMYLIHTTNGRNKLKFRCSTSSSQCCCVIDRRASPSLTFKPILHLPLTSVWWSSHSVKYRLWAKTNEHIQTIKADISRIMYCVFIVNLLHRFFLLLFTYNNIQYNYGDMKYWIEINVLKS